ncbi:MAG: alpha/beta fold hydrolase [Solirubrobacteraceae bacterium]
MAGPSALVDAPQTQYVKSGDGHLAYQVCGDGPVDLVFLAAWASHVEENWKISGRWLRSLASWSRLIVLDLRGTGLSDPVAISEMTSLERWMDETLVVLDAVDSERAALVGTGGGGPLAALFAATHPDRTKALVLHRTAARFTTAPDYPWGLAPERVPGYLDQIEREWGTGAVLARSLSLRREPPEVRGGLARLERYIAGPSAFRAAMKMSLESDIRGILSSVGAPTLVAHQAGDRFNPVEHSRYLSEHISGARYVEVPSFLKDPEAAAATFAEFITGARPPLVSDRVLATVLFTDIVDSTRTAAALGDRRWREMLDGYDQATAAALEVFRGRQVKTTGDGTLATFDGPGRAIRCALELSDTVEQLGVQIRAGLHTGEIETRGEDVAGIAVHIGQRISSIARPREVLVSRTVKDLVAGSEFKFTDLGLQKLKGVPEEWQVFSAGR